MSTSSFGSAFSTGSGGAGSNDAISYGQNQSLIGVQRLQAARNSGTLVTLSYELAPPGSSTLNVASALPRLPRMFMIHDVALTTYEFTQYGSDSMSMSLYMTTSLAETVVNADVPFLDGVSSYAPLTTTLGRGTMLNCSTGFYNSGMYGSSATGLVLWIRGVWLE